MDDRTLSHGSEGKPQVLREFEFYGGCIRVKISVKNTSSLAILDVELELESDERVLHFDRCEPEYPEKRGKLHLGNIHPNTDRTIAFYLDPLICAKEGTDINCRISYKDASGRPDSVQMETLKIKVVCPIFRTEQEINIGRLQELIAELRFNDSKVYMFPKKVELREILRSCRDVIQFHDVRHIKTFKTADEKTYESWYYGKTKVTKKDLVIKCAIRKDTDSIEVFVSGDDPKDITGLLAEIGRNLTREFDKIGKVQPVFNVVVKNSMVKGSNLLSFCDLDGICGGNVVIEDSFLEGTNVASWNKEDKEKMQMEEQKKLEVAQKREKEHEIVHIETAEKSSGGKWFFGVIIILAMLAVGWYGTQDSSSPVVSTPQKTTPSVTTAALMIDGVTLSGDWVRNPTNGHYYKLTASLNWLQAEAQAVEMGGHLVTINDNNENAWLVSTFGSSESFWIGYTDKDDEGNWKWISAETSTYTNWFQHAGGGWEPNNFEQGEDAGIINFIFRDQNEYGPGKWNDVKEDAQMRGIVEISMIPETINSTPQLSPGFMNKYTTTRDQKTITNSIGMEFVSIQAGEFDMGSPANETGRRDSEGPVHRVKISSAFYMGKYEVTQKQWRDVMGSSSSSFKGDNLPVESVSWNEVQEFIKKLNENKGSNKYRLPSEVEWEYAARAGTTTRFSFGDDESKLSEYAWYDSNQGDKTHSVGQKNPNPWGLYDMHGNVWEWVQDKWHNDYYGAPTEGSSWGSGDSTDRVTRGGCWNPYTGGCRLAYRDKLDPVSSSYALGFRLVMDL
jgi:formylglycine-generating enzyme required for sulfatase activity